MESDPPTVLFLGRWDWANVCNRVARAMNATAGRVVARVCTVHANQYQFDEDVVLDHGGFADIASFAQVADWIVSTGDGDYSCLFDLASRFGVSARARLATNHVGSAYRLRSEEFNRVDGSLFRLRLVGADLLRLCTSELPTVAYFAPPDRVAEDAPAGPLRIGHSPSNRVTKGTHVIEAVLRDFSDVAEIDIIEHVPFAECAARRARCGIFVDQLQSDIGGFGASAVEALAVGCAVLADVRNVSPACAAHFTIPPIVHAASAAELRAKLAELVRNPEQLATLRAASLAWAQAHATPEAVANHWWRALRDHDG